MPKQFLLIELSHNTQSTANGEPMLHDVYVEISHPENIVPFATPCKDRNAIQNTPALCAKITSWLRLFGIFAILDKSDQEAETPHEIHLCDGTVLAIDGWEVVDQQTKDRRMASNVTDPQLWGDDVLKVEHEFTDSLSISKNNTDLTKGVLIATRNSYSNNFDLVLECLLEEGKHYDLYQGEFAQSTIQVVLSDKSPPPLIKVEKTTQGAEYLTCNALELFKDSMDAYNCDSEHLDSYVKLDVSRFEHKTIEMDYIELQVVNHGGDLFAFMGNDPAN